MGFCRRTDGASPSFHEQQPAPPHPDERRAGLHARWQRRASSCLHERQVHAQQVPCAAAAAPAARCCRRWLACHSERPAQGVECELRRGAAHAEEERGGGGQGGVPAERHLQGGREPAQAEARARRIVVIAAAVAALEEGGLRQVHLAGNRLPRGVRQRQGAAWQQHHGRWIAGKGFCREGVHLR